MHYIKLYDNNERFFKLKEQLVTDGLATKNDGNNDFLMCVFDDNTESGLVNALSDYIWNIKFLDYVMRHIKKFDGDCLREIDIIINTMNVANSFKECNDTVSERIYDYLSENKEINLDGFMNFRLRDFLNDFDNLLCFYQKSYEVEAEYFDFICTLKECFAESEHAPYGQSEVHIVSNGGVSYILNSDGVDITEKSIKEYTYSADDEEISRDDKIVSTLISMSPKVLHLHTNKFTGTPVLFDTLKALFACRVIIE